MVTNSDNSGAQRQKKERLNHLLQAVMLTSLIVTGGLAISRFLGFFEKIEIAAYDSFIRLKPVEPLDDRFLVIGISEEDIQNRQEYPIKEGTVIELLEELGRHEPRAIALNFPLDFPQGTAAERKRLTELLEGSNHIVSACLISSEQFPGIAPAPGVNEELVAFADFPQDSDGIIRRSILVSAPTALFVNEVVRSHLCNQPGEELLSLSLLLAVIYLEDEGFYAEQTEAGNLLWHNTVAPKLFRQSGGYANAEVVDYEIMLNYRAPQDAVRQVSLSDVLEDQVDPEWIRNRIVLVGYTSLVVNDMVTTPYFETSPGFRGMSGVMVHAQATSQLISAVLDGRPLIWSWPEIGEIFLIGVWSLIGGLIAFYARRVRLFWVWMIGSLILLWALSYYVFILGLWLPVASMTAAVVLTAVAVAGVVRASHSVYVQAIFEQLQAVISGQWANQKSYHRDRLEDLVLRAQAIRQRRAIRDVLEQGDMDRLAADPLHLKFDAPEVQTFYERIKTQLQQKFNEEKATLETQKRQQEALKKSVRLQSLIERSQTVRSAQPIPPSPKSGAVDD